VDKQLEQLTRTVSFLLVVTALGALCNVLLLKRLEDTEERVDRLGGEVIGHRGMVSFLYRKIVPESEEDVVDVAPFPEPQDEPTV
jgi:hypothetical protein